MRVMTEEEVQLARHASHYWLDLENGRFYKKKSLVVAILK